MTEIGLIRHGITEWNSLGKAQGISDIPLNDQGEKQAIELGNRLLSEQSWDLIISSDLTRAKETANIISSRVDLPIKNFDERIRELDCGKIEGTTEVERVQIWGSNWRDCDLGMERFESVANRGIEFLEEVRREYSGRRILVVSHGALIGITLQHLIPEQFTTTYIDNTSLTILQNNDDRWHCRLYNCTTHLG
ncbi:histidine phosphatase family protein [Alkalibacillus haloalkaliphilus]|uniref:Phosphoglycerate mutase n=1 Tax=Alkalibacillus haloalkaliphilus TaxID=94136 RepID=A0A511W510_9BACI|nr:histidine phosphatase family protein [Alkalibacillus haloalkaliphilus]GEN46194.1 phosphoglycerate mutase [Alkalibacillus haloalkaliphilus]